MCPMMTDGDGQPYRKKKKQTLGDTYPRNVECGMWTTGAHITLQIHRSRRVVDPSSSHACPRCASGRRHRHPSTSQPRPESAATMDRGHRCVRRAVSSDRSSSSYHEKPGSIHCWPEIPPAMPPYLSSSAHLGSCS
jgi:hypothetical protein